MIRASKEAPKPFRSCAKCNRMFLCVLRSASRKHCDDCHKSWANVSVAKEAKRGSRNLIEIVCIECGKAAAIWKGNKTSGLFCSRQCSGRNRSRKAQARSAWRVAEVMAAQSAKAVSCGMVLWARSLHRIAHKQQVNAECAQCGRRYRIPNDGRARKYCGHCVRVRHGAGRWKVRSEKLAQSINRIDIWNAEGWQCYICGTVCEKPKPEGGWFPRMATIDHVIPRSKGGTNKRSNLRTCCAECNKQKKDLSLQEMGMMGRVG